MRKGCPVCLGTGFVEEEDGDGHGGDTKCIYCEGNGNFENPEAERDIKE